MSSSLEDLFVQVLKSEQKAQERKNVLIEVKNQVAEYKQKVEHARNEKQKLNGQLVIKVQQWNNEQQDLHWMTNREKISQSQQEELIQKRHQLTGQLADIEGELDKEREAFFKKSREFSRFYDLLSWKTGSRRSKVIDEIAELKETQKKLKLDVDKAMKENEEVLNLEKKKTDLSKSLDEKKRQLKDLQEKRDRIANRLNAAIVEKKRVADIPQTDEEHRRIHSEIESCRENGMEAICHSLRRELEELRRHKWQRDMQQRQQAQKHKYNFKPKVNPGGQLKHNAVGPLDEKDTANSLMDDAGAGVKGGSHVSMSYAGASSSSDYHDEGQDGYGQKDFNDSPKPSPNSANFKRFTNYVKTSDDQLQPSDACTSTSTSSIGNAGRKDSQKGVTFADEQGARRPSILKRSGTKPQYQTTLSQDGDKDEEIKSLPIKKPRLTGRMSCSQ